MGDEPFVKFIQYVKRISAESSFISERVAALKLWADAENWKRILAREEDQDTASIVVVIDAVAVSGLVADGQSVDAYLVAYDGNRRLLTISVVENCQAATWREVNVACRHHNDKPIFFEAWDDNYGSDR